MSFNCTVQLEVVFTDVCKSENSIITVNIRNKQNISMYCSKVDLCMHVSLSTRKQNILAK